MTGGPWLDAVHWIGLVGGFLILVALAVGLYLLLAFRRGGRLSLRGKVRNLHILGGGLAIAFALGHVAGRAVQAGSVEFELDPARLIALALVLVLVTGLMRRFTPGFLQGHYALLAWAHRLAVLAVLILLGLHVVAAFRIVMM
ncbi:MAG: hypothetical protein ABFE16_09910 [Armatimonadia bacterium]